MVYASSLSFGDLLNQVTPKQFNGFQWVQICRLRGQEKVLYFFLAQSFSSSDSVRSLCCTKHHTIAKNGLFHWLALFLRMLV